ncbi:hypothetical protein BVX98_01335 [bacterium F11]|nr:hypothetical protein BVX98_01335 [bacterium F11]
MKPFQSCTLFFMLIVIFFPNSSAFSEESEKFLNKTQVYISKFYEDESIPVAFTGGTLGRLEGLAGGINDQGSIAHYATIIDYLKEIVGDDHLLVDAGNFYPDDYKNPGAVAKVFMEALDIIGYDAVGIGPLDLELGKKYLKKIDRKTNLHFISTNLVRIKSEKPIFKPYVFKNVGGKQLAVLSLLPPINLDEKYPKKWKNTKIVSPEEALKRFLPKIKGKSDKIVVLSGMGIYDLVDLKKKFPEVALFLGSTPMDDDEAYFLKEREETEEIIMVRQEIFSVNNDLEYRGPSVYLLNLMQTEQKRISSMTFLWFGVINANYKVHNFLQSYGKLVTR